MSKEIGLPEMPEGKEVEYGSPGYMEAEFPGPVFTADQMRDYALKAQAMVSPAIANKATEEGELPELPQEIEVGGEGWDFEDFKSQKTFSVDHMREYAREAIAADRASRQVANKAEVETIDTPEFRELLAAFKNSSLGFDYNETVKNLVAHINGRFATPLATTGASTVLTDERIGRVVLPAGFVLMPEKPSYLIIAAMASSQAEDEDGPFVPMLDLLDFSGENKAHTALKAAYCAAVVASSLEKKSA